MSDIRSIILWTRTDDAQGTGVECRWATSQTTRLHCGDCTPVQTIDVVFTANPGLVRAREETSNGSHGGLLESNQSGLRLITAESENALPFLRECLQATIRGHTFRLARFVIPLQSGSIIKSDVLPYRLQDSFWAEKTVTFASPLQVFSGIPLPVDSISMSEILCASAGAVLLKPETSLPILETGMAIVPPEVESDFVAKLSIRWISPAPIHRKRLVLVGTSIQDPLGGGWTQFARRATVTLGIDLVVIDREDGWMGRGAYGSWYDTRLTLPPSWWAQPSADELVRLVTGMRVDGIATFAEVLQVTVSEAASRLGLPHEQVSAFENATNKFKLALHQNRPALLASCAEDVMTLVKPSGDALKFPLIVKPCFGLNSEGITRVDEKHQLRDAIDAARTSGKQRSEVGDRVLVERYCDGPEVDVNMVFVDGEVVFGEICDDFPKGADACDSGADVGYAVTKNSGSDSKARPLPPPKFPGDQHIIVVFPSALPDNELAALRKAVKDTIQGLGFKNGVLHVEARIAQSTHEYQSVGGIVDLRPRQKNISRTECTAGRNEPNMPIPWIIEINTRPPGLFASQTPGSVYGIDYWCISVLLAIGDKARAVSLSRPFANGAQSHSVLVMIRAEFDAACEGIFDSDDICEELLARHPELKEHTGRFGCLLQRGQKIPHPGEGTNTFVAYMNVFSRTSRQEALGIAKQVREEIRYTIR